MKKVNDCWMDKDKNFWDSKYCTKKQAVLNSKSLVGCTKCMNCIDCFNCIFCRDCTNCTDCTDCGHCKNCIDCIGCVGCESCLEFRSWTDCTGLYDIVEKKSEGE